LSRYNCRSQRDYAEVSQIVNTSSDSQRRAATIGDDRESLSRGRASAAAANGPLLGNSALNARYAQVPAIAAGAKFRTLGRRRPADESGSTSGGLHHDETTTTMTSGSVSDMDRWLEHVFDQALDGTVDDVDNERTLSGRLKGGGDNPNQPSKVDARVFTYKHRCVSSVVFDRNGLALSLLTNIICA